jgi:Acetoacetate decarboxylase (ADC)
MPNPNFIDYPGNIVMSQPFVMQWTQMFGFISQGNTAALQAMVDQRLNFMTDRPDTKYFVGSDKVIFAFATSVTGHSLAGDITKGYMGEQGLNMFVLVVKCQMEKGEWNAKELLLFPPFIFVDNPFSMAVGRETFGFQKSIGNIYVPQSPGDAYNFGVDTIAFNQFNAQSRAYMQNIFSVNRVISGTTSPKSDKDAYEEHSSHSLFSKLKELLSPSKDSGIHISWTFLWDEIKSLAEGKIPMVFLRQFRDVADGSKAAYQAIIEIDSAVSAFRGAWIYSDPFQITIPPVASFPFCSILGVPASSQSHLSFWCDIDLYLGNGTEVYRST